MTHWLIVCAVLAVSIAIGVVMLAVSPAIAGLLLVAAFAAVCRLGWWMHRYPDKDGGAWQP